MRFQRLHPDPREVDVSDQLDVIGSLAEHAPAERPYVLVNFVSSVDGHAALQGRSGGLGDDGDRAMFHGLRECVDAVIAGTTTMRVEKYGRILGKAERRERRRQRGQTPEPLACIVSRSGRIPLEIPLFAEPQARVVVFSPSEPDLSAVSARVDCEPLGDPPFATALARLRSDYGVRTILCEGGPTVFGSLLREGVVDELFLTVAPKLAGGGASMTIAAGPELHAPATLELRWLLEREGSLFHRYALR